MNANEREIDLLVATSAVLQTVDAINTCAPALADAGHAAADAFARFKDSVCMWCIEENKRVRAQFSSN